MTAHDYLFRGTLAAFDPAVADLIRHETARQSRYLILIPSESTIPEAVRAALTSPFHNIYAEGYPLDETRWLAEDDILDYPTRLTEYRRMADKRYYKGTEYADIVEALARRRAAELFASERISADKLFVNVQPLSGAPANNAIYSALLAPGDTVMGLDLLHGGHLTHGSPVNRSGKNYRIVSYGVNPDTELLDYDEIKRLALEHRPKMIIAGYTSYPFAPDWAKFRDIADSVGAILMADIAHVAGMVATGAYPSPVGIADVVSFTTHKTLGGPRGAVIITHKETLATKIDRAVFPGEQGGPHVNTIAAIAVALKLASTPQFHELQHQTVTNARRLAEQLAAHGLRIPHGGTDTHLLLIDCKTIVGPDGTPLSGDMAARILDLAGIVVNRNTIPGDRTALNASGLRLGTPWVTQRGFREPEIDQLSAHIANLLKACVPFSYAGRKGDQPRAKVDFDTLQHTKRAIRDMAAHAGIDTDAQADGYPHFYYMEEESSVQRWHTLEINGENAADFLQVALTNDVSSLTPGSQIPAWLLNADGSVLSAAVLEYTAHKNYLLHVATNVQRAAAWLRALSDGLIMFDPIDPFAKVPGPVAVSLVGETNLARLTVDIDIDWYSIGIGYTKHKPYFVGIHGANYLGLSSEPLPAFAWSEPKDAPIKTTTLHALHQTMGAKMVPFAGYDMPVWYTSVIDEHHAVRTGAGLFDVSHMGVFDASGPGAVTFLNSVTTNEVDKLEVGQSHYTYLLDTNGIPLDDLMIYRIAAERYLIVVNASNNDKNWAWLNAVKNGDVLIDPLQPSRTVTQEGFTLRDLRDPVYGSECRVDIALQGPHSRNILLQLHGTTEDKARITALPWAGITHVTLGGYDLLVSRTGYTGERVAFEIFVHPDQAPALFKDLIEGGAVACGLASRDSTRTEAGLPLYGHELAGDLNLNPADAGFGSYIRLWKPFFVGKQAYIEHEAIRDSEISRFRLDNKGVRPPQPGDPVLDRKGRVVGIVTSCSIDSEGYQLGQAYLKDEFRIDGTPVLVFAGAGRTKAGKPLDSLTFGDRVPLPEPATVQSRFPTRKKS